MLAGFIVVDKPQGMTSADVVYHIKRRLPKGTKIGHAGTLDPNVTGVLPLAVGYATKAFAFLEDTEKSYRVTLQLGFATETEDIWGEVVDRAPVPSLSREQIEEAVNSFVGDYWQTPPMYSAKKIDGVKLYNLARSGKVVERKPELRRIVAISDLTIDNLSTTAPTINLQEAATTIGFTVRCSRGTYIRTLCLDLAKKLGTLGTMTSLRRLATDCFTEDLAVPLETLVASEDLSTQLLPVQAMFEQLPRIIVDVKHATHLRNGVKVNLARFLKGWAMASSDVRYGVWERGEVLRFIGVAAPKDDGIYFQQWLTD